MELVAEYRTEAARCRAMAAKERHPKDRAMLLEIARQFEELADLREQMLRPEGLPVSPVEPVEPL